MTGPRVLLVDNYDSFTWNLVHLLEGLGAGVDVVRNDAISAGEASTRPFTHLVISPGPGVPERAGITCDLIRRTLPRAPILGVCLGHQALAVALGGRLRRADPPVHGEAAVIEHSGRGLFAGLPARFSAARYHSLVIDKSTLPAGLVVEATIAGDPSLVMAVRHASLPAFGVQFHPESFLTPWGRDLAAAFLESRA